MTRTRSLQVAILTMDVQKTAVGLALLFICVTIKEAYAFPLPLTDRVASLSENSSFGTERLHVAINDSVEKGSACNVSAVSAPSHSDFIRFLDKENDGNGTSDPVVVVRGMSTETSDAEEYDQEVVNSEMEGTIQKADRKTRRSRENDGIKPFSVKIEDEIFYGGLVTYSHNQHPARICRVMNACVRPEGTLVLPHWMKRHDNMLRFHCGHSNLEFSLPDTSRPPTLQSFDLVGLEVPRPSMPDFLRDFIGNAVIFDLIYGDHQVTKSCHSRRGKECDPFPALMQGFKPTLYLHSRLKVLGEKKSWVRQFIKLMKPAKFGLQPRVEYDTLSRDEPAEMKCYRSAFFTRGPYNRNFIMSDHLRNMHFFEANDISKRARSALRKVTTRKGKEKKECHLNVTISNRQLIDGASNRLIGRYIMNIPDLRKAILRRAKRIPGLKIKVATMTLEGKTLRWQINGMQKTDIWVAGLGPLLTNMVFLRENSTVIEIQPFAYYPKDYENIARYLAHVNYEQYIAHPDVEAFKTCVHQVYPKKHDAREKALEILEKYLMAVEKYKQADSTHSYVLSRLNETGLGNIKVCAQMQRLDTNAKNLAIAVVRQARLRCGFPKMRLQSNSN